MRTIPYLRSVTLFRFRGKMLQKFEYFKVGSVIYFRNTKIIYVIKFIKNLDRYFEMPLRCIFAFNFGNRIMLISNEIKL